MTYPPGSQILLVSTVISFIEWFEQGIIELLLQEFGCQVHIACNCDYLADTSPERTQEFMARARDAGVVFHNIPFARSPFHWANFRAYRMLQALLDKEHFSVIHCHTPLASILTRLAAQKVRKKGAKVLCTSHGFHFFQGASWRNWLLYYPIEKYCASLTDILITINQEDFALAHTHFHAGQVQYVPGVGVDIERYSRLPDRRAEKRRELGLSEHAIVLLGVGELNENKNHRIILEALAQIQESDVHFVLAGKGPLADELLSQAKAFGLKDQFHSLGFRRDVSELYKLADIMVFPSLREGLPLSVMEGMAAGLPFVASRIRGICDLILDERGGFLCQPKDSRQFADAIQKLLHMPQLRENFGNFNRIRVQAFSRQAVEADMKKIYGTILTPLK